MTVRPILFSGPMVVALLEGRKTQTRRLLKPQPPEWAVHASCLFKPVSLYQWSEAEQAPPRELDRWPNKDEGTKLRWCPCDLLWVRETWAPPIGGRQSPEWVQFRADHDEKAVKQATRKHGSGWRSAIHMPRWASRITLQVTDVRVQRLQEISREDAIAEGIAWSDRSSGYSYDPVDGGPGYHASDPRESFFTLWRSINGDDSVDANPWIVAVTFATHKANVDTVLAQLKLANAEAGGWSHDASARQSGEIPKSTVP